MVAKYTVKIGKKWYKAGDTLPDIVESKAVSTPKEVEPPFMNEPIEVKDEKQPEPQKRRYTRRK